jgi:hypothetical protein
LRNLEIELSALFEYTSDSKSDASEHADDEAHIPRLVDIMPESLETLRLNCVDYDPSVLTELLADFAEEKEARLPNLKTIIYCGKTMEDAAKEELKKAGVRIGRKKWPFKLRHVTHWETDFKAGEGAERFVRVPPARGIVRRLE